MKSPGAKNITQEMNKKYLKSANPPGLDSHDGLNVTFPSHASKP
jgi:hypothetical protein